MNNLLESNILDYIIITSTIIAIIVYYIHIINESTKKNEKINFESEFLKLSTSLTPAPSEIDKVPCSLRAVQIVPPTSIKRIFFIYLSLSMVVCILSACYQVAEDSACFSVKPLGNTLECNAFGSFMTESITLGFYFLQILEGEHIIPTFNSACVF